MPRLTQLSMGLPYIFYADLLIQPCFFYPLGYTLPICISIQREMGRSHPIPEIDTYMEGTIRIYDVLKLPLHCPHLNLLINRGGLEF